MELVATLVALFAIGGSAALGVLLFRASVGAREVHVAPELARELTRLGFEQTFGGLFAHRDGRQVVVSHKEATVVLAARRAPFGEFPVEANARFSDDGILVHFRPFWQQVQPALERADRLLLEIEEAGAWKDAAAAYGLRFRMHSGLRQISGETGDGIDVSIRQEGSEADVRVAVPAGVWAREGKGSAGNVVLDMLIDSQGIPQGIAEQVLDVVHGRQGRIESGALLVRWQGEMDACLDTVIAIARGLRE
jgi:hypothetical protein